MDEAIFIGRTEDNKGLVFSDENGHEFFVEIDQHLIRNINTPTSSPESEVNSGISPRDIQTRIRRGETAADIAAEAGVEVSRIERYAGPVLAERSFQAAKAAQTFVRRPGIDETLETLVIRQLTSRSIDTMDLDWDSWRREDGRWTVMVSWPSGHGTGVATWLFDPVSLTIVSVDDEARWLMDEARIENTASTPEPDNRPRLVSIPAPQQDAPTPTDTHSEYSADDNYGDYSDDQSVDQTDDIEPPAWAGPGHPTMPVPVAPVVTNDDSPSWDDILFGQRPTE